MPMSIFQMNRSKDPDPINGAGENKSLKSTIKSVMGESIEHAFATSAEQNAFSAGKLDGNQGFYNNIYRGADSVAYEQGFRTTKADRNQKVFANYYEEDDAGGKDGLNEELIEEESVKNYLIQGIAREFTAIKSYVRASSILDVAGFPKAAKILMDAAKQEMGHADSLIDRLNVLGGDTQMTDQKPIELRNDISEIFEDAIGLENEAIELYNRAVNFCQDASDNTSADLFQKILNDEEAHHLSFTQEVGKIARMGVSYEAELTESVKQIVANARSRKRVL